MLDIAFTSLSGTLPPSYGDLDSVWLWYMFGNSLSGTIPTQFGKLGNVAGARIGRKTKVDDRTAEEICM